MAILKYLGMLLYAARAARAETERTPLVPLVSIRELHEDFSGKVEDAECERKPELVNAHEDVLVVAGECSGYKDFVVAADQRSARVGEDGSLAYDGPFGYHEQQGLVLGPVLGRRLHAGL